MAPEGLAVTLPELNRFVIFQRGRGDDVLCWVACRRDHNICKQGQSRTVPCLVRGATPTPSLAHPAADRRLAQPFLAPSFQGATEATSTVLPARLAHGARGPRSRTGQRADRVASPGLESCVKQKPLSASPSARGRRQHALEPAPGQTCAVPCTHTHLAAVTGLAAPTTRTFPRDPEPMFPLPPITAGTKALEGAAISV